MIRTLKFTACAAALLALAACGNNEGRRPRLAEGSDGHLGRRFLDRLPLRHPRG